MEVQMKDHEVQPAAANRKKKTSPTPGALYKFPWEGIGNWKYAVVFLPIAVKALHVSYTTGQPWHMNMFLHVLILAGVRYLCFQIWTTINFLPAISRKYQIVDKSLTFDQIDHEASWENMILVNTWSLWLLCEVHEHSVFGVKELYLWNTKGVLLALLFHIGPVEWVYYWAHRALHHHYLFTRYHSHHHSSFVTQPITSSNHPFLEHFFYAYLFGLIIAPAYFMNLGSIGLFYFNALFVDFMNAWGHCNFEFIPKSAYAIFPPLKYIVYSPTFHSLHHTKVHTNFSLFVPFYDYLYGTVDKASESLHQIACKGRKENVDCVYLTHVMEILSIFHFPFGFQTFAAHPYNTNKWYLWLLWPFTLPLVLLMWLFATPFVGLVHHVLPSTTYNKALELQTWVIPRFNFQYHMKTQKTRINGWIEDCIIQAHKAGAKIVALGLLNKEVELNVIKLEEKGVCTPLVTGETLATAIVVKRIAIARNSKDHVFLTHANSRMGRAIATYLVERVGRKVLAMFPSQKEYESLRARIAMEFQQNLIYAKGYEAGKECKVWIVGDQLGYEEQRRAPKGTYFHLYSTFPIRKHRVRDCTYGMVPGLRLPANAQNLHTCQDVMPRNVARASYAAGMLHVLEAWQHHDFKDDILVSQVESSWEAALKHGFSLYSP